MCFAKIPNEVLDIIVEKLGKDISFLYWPSDFLRDIDLMATNAKSNHVIQTAKKYLDTKGIEVDANPKRFWRKEYVEELFDFEIDGKKMQADKVRHMAREKFATIHDYLLWAWTTRFARSINKNKEKEKDIQNINIPFVNELINMFLKTDNCLEQLDLMNFYKETPEREGDAYDHLRESFVNLAKLLEYDKQQINKDELMQYIIENDILGEKFGCRCCFKYTLDKIKFHFCKGNENALMDVIIDCWKRCDPQLEELIYETDIADVVLDEVTLERFHEIQREMYIFDDCDPDILVAITDYMVMGTGSFEDIMDSTHIWIDNEFERMGRQDIEFDYYEVEFMDMVRICYVDAVVFEYNMEKKKNHDGDEEDGYIHVMRTNLEYLGHEYEDIQEYWPKHAVTGPHIEKKKDLKKIIGQLKRLDDLNDVLNERNLYSKLWDTKEFEEFVMCDMDIDIARVCDDIEESSRKVIKGEFIYVGCASIDGMIHRLKEEIEKLEAYRNSGWELENVVSNDNARFYKHV